MQHSAADVREVPSKPRYSVTQAVVTGLGWLAAALWVLALPVFLMMSTGALAVNQPRLYYYGFDHFDISTETGIKTQDLRQVARDMIAYFNNGEMYFDPQVEMRGQPRPLFQEREIVHLKDVKDLVHQVYWVAGLSLAYLVGYVGLRLSWRRRAAVRSLLRLALYGGALTLATLVVVGIWSAVDFSWLFYLFHIVSFSNLFWQLDPAQYMLTRLFTEGFFLQATLFIATGVAAEALAIASVSGWMLARSRGR